MLHSLKSWNKAGFLQKESLMGVKISSNSGSVTHGWAGMCTQFRQLLKLKICTGIGAILAQLQEGTHPNICTGQRMRGQTLRAARESTTKATPIFSHAATQSSCLHFLFLKPTPSHVQWFLIQPRPEQRRQTLSKTTVLRETYHNAQIHLKRKGHSSSKFVQTITTLPQHRKHNAHAIILGKFSTYCVWQCRDCHATEKTQCSQGWLIFLWIITHLEIWPAYIRSKTTNFAILFQSTMWASFLGNFS